MVSVLVLGFETATGQPPTSSEAVRTLSALVAGAVDGVIRDVTLISSGSTGELGKVADFAGCGFLAVADGAEGLRVGAARARSEHVLVLLAGVSFDRALTDEIAVQASRPAEARDRGVRVRVEGPGWLGRIVPALAPTVGLLTTRPRLATSRAADFASLLAALRPSRSFKTKAWSGEA